MPTSELLAPSNRSAITSRSRDIAFVTIPAGIGEFDVVVEGFPLGRSYTGGVEKIALRLGGDKEAIDVLNNIGAKAPFAFMPCAGGEAGGL